MSKLVHRIAAPASVVLCSLLGAPAAYGTDVADSTVADPEAHQVMLENEHVRVLRVVAAPGYESPLHSHPPLLIVSLGAARIETRKPDGTKRIVDLHPGQAIWSDANEHSWKLLAGEIDIVAGEVKAAEKPAEEAAPPAAAANRP